MHDDVKDSIQEKPFQTQDVVDELFDNMDVFPKYGARPKPTYKALRFRKTNNEDNYPMIKITFCKLV